ncbi:MAG TPA: sialidase family protein [Ignavibacteria bacterium]|jgi:hypothetical protein
MINLKFLVALLFIPLVFFGQFKNIKVNTSQSQANEVTIFINPANPNNIIGAANLNFYYWSIDKGLTWTEGKLESETYGVWGDPCLVFDLQGNAYYFHLSRPSKQQWIDRIVCQKSTDGGMSWSSPGTYTGLNLPKKQDKQWACVDYTGGPKKNNIYATWTQFDAYGSADPLDSSNIMFSLSSDEGLNWSTAKRINQFGGDCRDSDNTTEGAVPCVGPNGEIYVSWSGPRGIIFDRSTDGGKTWLDNDISVSPHIIGWAYDIEGIYRCNGMPVTGCDISSSQYKGNVYINYSDSRIGDEEDVDVFVVRSTDGGTSWNDPVRVNKDAQGNKKQQFMNWMSVDPVTGAVNVLYYDRRDYNDTKTDVCLARSTDGGISFTEYKISEKPFTPSQNVFFGDYINVCSYNNQVACIWQRMDEGILSIIYCGIEF